jgi:hypothetical protein
MTTVQPTAPPPSPIPLAWFLMSLFLLVPVISLNLWIPSTHSMHFLMLNVIMLHGFLINVAVLGVVIEGVRSVVVFVSSGLGQKVLCKMDQVSSSAYSGSSKHPGVVHNPKPTIMRTWSLLVAALLLGTSSANIIFTHVPLSCDSELPGYTGCLRGQTCTESGSYDSVHWQHSPHFSCANLFFRCNASMDSLYPISFRRSPHETLQPRAGPYSADGQCGASNGDLLCDPASTVYTVSSRLEPFER